MSLNESKLSSSADFGCTSVTWASKCSLSNICSQKGQVLLFRWTSFSWLAKFALLLKVSEHLPHWWTFWHFLRALWALRESKLPNLLPHQWHLWVFMSVLQNLTSMATNVSERTENKNICVRFCRKKWVCLLFFLTLIILTVETLVVFQPLVLLWASYNKTKTEEAMEEEMGETEENVKNC